ncbi:MAG: peroxiredoxin [Bradyrhizobium sp.]|nr:peroxiredoxin [Bradyrhizobium sp.]MBU6462555.1 peroxiredoxin [Pseudomonadota bacterium]MDE2068554.1 peroxiredoxin [Bradyrhizobium sp.]MDE2240931.1 peroxiredoxin [Bradyrhizobium sp.]
MSKKSQKKTSKKSSKAAGGRASSARPKKMAAKSPGNIGKRSAVKASHQGASKPLKSQPPGITAKSKAAAAKSARALAASQRAAVPAMTHSGLAEGTKAPAFRLPRDGGASVSLSDFAGQKLVLFFYPRADTPGCTREAIDFTRLSRAFAESRTAVLGISADPPRTQEAFRNKHQLSVPLASDEQHEMLEAYGVWGEKSMYGRTFLGISRTTVLIGADGRVIRIWRNVRVDGHADEVLAAAQNS